MKVAGLLAVPILWLALQALEAQPLRKVTAIDPPDNFSLCQTGAEGCDYAALTDDQKRVIVVMADGRNVLACAESQATCDPTRLTSDQIQAVNAVRAERKAQHIAPILAGGRNFSACAYGKPDCDMSVLTPEQRDTLARMFVERTSQARYGVVADGRSVQNSGSPIDPSKDPGAGRRERLRRFGVGAVSFLNALAQAYVEAETTRLANPPTPVIVSGGGVVVASGQGIVVPTRGTVVQSQIAGTFRGWTGETVFTLANGQVWQQASYSYKYHYAYSPKVTIYPSNGGYKMQVDGVTDAVSVRRLR